MRRRGRGWLVAAGMMLASTIAGMPTDSLAKPAKKAPDYFPLRTNDWWRYRSTQANGSTSEFTLKVISEEPHADGTIRHCIELSNPKPLIRDWYTKTASGVVLNEEEYLGGGGKITLEPPRPILQMPLTPGERWTWSGTARAHTSVEESNEVAGVERLEVPAGRFDAVKILTQIEQGGVHASKTSWFAPGVGLVRQSTDSGGVTSTTELLEYSFQPKR